MNSKFFISSGVRRAVGVDSVEVGVGVLASSELLYVGCGLSCCSPQPPSISAVAVAITPAPSRNLLLGISFDEPLGLLGL